jgi:antitoxin (DNA-binding transcriptional repressor) of toxin-antitoxin stability system
VSSSRRLVSIAACLVVVLAACSGDSDDAAPADVDAGPPEVYVAIGSDQTVGTSLDRPLVEAWPRLFYRATLGRSAVFVNAATEGSTVAQALEEQLPLALELEPTLVTVWLNVNDLAAGVPVETYERQLAELVRALRRGGQTEVLVANIPPVAPTITLPDSLSIEPDVQGADGGAGLDNSPSPPEFSESDVARRVAVYNDAIARVVAADGATLVDLRAAATGSPAAADGVDLTPEGHARVAELFADAL